MSQGQGPIEREVFIEAEPRIVFRYLIDPKEMARWIGISRELEPRPGGTFRIEVSKGRVASGKYTEVVPDRRVAFTWGWEPGPEVQAMGLGTLPPGSSLVEIDLFPQEGGTLVRLRHSGLPEGLSGIHGERWMLYLGKLKSSVRETGSPR